MSRQYRPAGPLHWVIDRLPNHSHWNLVGTIAAEPRANEVARELYNVRKLRNSCFIDVEDERSEFFQATQTARAFHRQELTRLLGSSPQSIGMELFSEVDDLDEMYSKIEPTIGPNAVLDITSLPKRFFFYLVRRLRETSDVKSLIVTYTVPVSYGKVLHKNPGGWMPLPSYGTEVSSSERPMLVIAVGYHHLNLMDLILDRTPKPIRLLMPFPSPSPGFSRNWEFIRYIRDQVEFNSHDIRRVDPFSVSLAFEHLRAQCSAHHGELILAPFGPKTLSLAMALYALAREDAELPVSVGYTQPIAYSDTYSTGVQKGPDGKSIIHAYCIKLNGDLLYEWEHKT